MGWATEAMTAGLTSSAPARGQGARRRSELATTQVGVGGRRVSYASGGSGLPVLFLHGWGLDHRVYERSLRRLTSRGCRVIAPSLPGFGGSDELPIVRRTLAGYAEWVDQFLVAIGADEPVVVLGHSFGGGIATRFAHDHPDRVRYLVLLNSVGDPRLFPSNGAGGRPRTPGFGGLGPVIDSLRPPDDLATTGLVQRALLRNLSRHPLSVMQTAQAALWADLRSEMAALAARGFPVLVLWSDDDRVIPLAAFDTFCATFGTDGHVVRGGHSWLLANPDVFAEVLDNVIHVLGEQHGARASTANIAQVRELLGATTMPRRVVARLLDGVSPLWVLSEAPEILAADLALCHPAIRAGEVRAVAREMSGGYRYRLTVAAEDRRGLLADTSAILAAEEISVESASVMTWPNVGLALHALTVSSAPGIDGAQWDSIGARLRQSPGAPLPITFKPSGRARVTRTGAGSGTSMVRVTAPDRVGMLSAVCRGFADQGLSIESAGVATADGIANDVFLVDGDCDTDALTRQLSETSPWVHAAGARLVRRLLSTLAC
jgi:pimeloyl-ACP methyl ester carboxylesterase/predicted amino acid-binding ACT domain protein